MARYGMVIDTRRCVDNASCDVPICEADGDDCIKQRIPMPVGGYGITVDFKQRVWIGGSVARYDPFAPPGARWTVVPPIGFVHGIAADSEGYVWGAAMGAVYRINADDPSQLVSVAGAEGWSAKGAAVDAEGKIWMINISHNNATVIVPGPGINDATVMTGIAPVFSTPYTYSDMTGTQQRYAMEPHGFYRATLAGCEDGETQWQSLTFNVTTPPHATVVIRVRTADALDALEDARWVTVASIPPDVSPVSVADALSREGVTPGAYLQVDIGLQSDIVDSTEPLSPVVYDLSVVHYCPEGPMY